MKHCPDATGDIDVEHAKEEEGLAISYRRRLPEKYTAREQITKLALLHHLALTSSNKRHINILFDPESDEIHLRILRCLDWRQPYLR